MADARPAAVVVADAPRPGRCRLGLEPLLGPEGCARLQATLVRRAAAWASAVGDAFLAFRPEGAAEEMATLAPGLRLLPQEGDAVGDRLAHAVDAVLERHDGPVLLVGADSPRLDRRHAWAAVDDLRSGCDVSIGPSADGGWYLVGLREAQRDLFALPEDAWGGPEVMRLTLERVAAGGLAVGMLRAERDLDDAADARALLADPTAPQDVVAALRGG